MQAIRVEKQLGAHTLILETGKLAKSVGLPLAPMVAAIPIILSNAALLAKIIGVGSCTENVFFTK